MTRFISVRAILACGLFVGVTAACAAQTYTPPPPPLTTLPPCPVDKDARKRAKRTDCDPTIYPSETIETKGKKSPNAPAVAPPADGTATDKFPFPGEQPSAAPSAAKNFPFPGDTAVDVPHDPADKKAQDAPPGKKFPFPGEATPDAPPIPQKADESSSSSGSPSSSDEDASGVPARSSASKNPDDDDEDQPKLKDKGSEGRRSKKVIKLQTDTDRVDEDLSVAKFYGQNGNSIGAYLRAKDAVKTQPEFPEGHFVLGEAAKRLNKRDEAVSEFQTYLKLAPDGKQAKAAEKALEELK